MTKPTSLTDLELRTAAQLFVSNFIIPNPLSMSASLDATKKLYYGTNYDMPSIAQRTPTHPRDEEPIFVLCYKDLNCPTHVAAYYDGKRVDFYPENVATGNVTLTDLGVMVLGDAPTQNIFREESNDPGRDNIDCFAIYPSQLGINPPPTPDDITRAIDNVKNANDYQLYSNNCADQVIRIFEGIGVNMDATKGSPSLPANVRNFAELNGYLVPHSKIPFINEASHNDNQSAALRAQRALHDARTRANVTRGTQASIEADQRIDDATARRVTNENATSSNAKANLNKGNSRD